MTDRPHPIAHLCSLIAGGDLDAAREWAHQHADGLCALRNDRDARATVAHACNRWGAPMVWPWGDTPQPVGAEQRVLSAIRSGRPWRASDDTVAVLIACGWASYADGIWRAA